MTWPVTVVPQSCLGTAAKIGRCCDRHFKSCCPYPCDHYRRALVSLSVIKSRVIDSLQSSISGWLSVWTDNFAPKTMRMRVGTLGIHEVTEFAAQRRTHSRISLFIKRFYFVKNRFLAAREWNSGAAQQQQSCPLLTLTIYTRSMTG